MLEKILEVFKKEYREEMKYYEFLEKNVKKMNSDRFDVDENIGRLRNRNFKSNFRIKTEV